MWRNCSVRGIGEESGVTTKTVEVIRMLNTSNAILNIEYNTEYNTEYNIEYNIE